MADSSADPEITSGIRWWRYCGTIVVLAAIGTAWRLLATQPGSCQNLQLGASFAGSSSRFADYVSGQHKHLCTLSGRGPVIWWMVVGAVVALIFGVVLWKLLTWWWPRAWTTGSLNNLGSIAVLPLVAGGLDIVENVFTALGVSVRGQPGARATALSSWAARALPVVAWPKMLLYAMSMLAVFAALGGAFNRRGLNAKASPGAPWTPEAVSGFGICCSGGGIRSAAISLGALGALEAHRADGTVVPENERANGPGVFNSAKYIASVSGGGYAVGAWRIASGAHPDSPGEWPTGFFGDPFAKEYDEAPPTDYDSRTTAATPSLYRHLQARREFLRTGRGGLPSSLLVLLGFLLVHLTVLLISLVMVAWPLGRLTRTWPVFGGIGCAKAYDRRNYSQLDYLPERLCPLEVGQNPSSLARDETLACHAIPVKPGDPLYPDRYLQHSTERTFCFLTTTGRQLPMRWGLYGPPLCILALALAAFVPKLFKWRTTRRRRWSIISRALFATAALFAAVLLGVPYLLDVIYPTLSTTAGLKPLLTSTGITGTAAVAARRFVTPRLKRSLNVAGSLALTVTAILLGTLIAGHAALGTGLVNGAGRLRGWPAYLGVLGLGIILFLLPNPQTWSLNTLYRNRIRGGFATSRHPEDGPRHLRQPRVVAGTDRREDPAKRLYPMKMLSEPTLDAYAQACSPIHLVCCSAARNSRSATGVPSLSFVLSADHVSLYKPERNGDHVDVVTFETDTPSFLAALARAGALPDVVKAASARDRLERRRRHAYGTTSAAITASGAAFGSAMGRFTKQYPSALFATFNLRLGVWLPNPRYLAVRPDRFPRPNLTHLFKELAGFWRLDDHHLYISDGGHRENLGLVELLRRRCRTIICIDSSGDSPGSFTTLRQAIDLARTEASARIETKPLDDQSAQSLDSRASKPHTMLTARYHHRSEQTSMVMPEATIIHIRPVVYPDLNDELVAFSAEDTQFPHYSTGNQFLTDEQFRHLVQYGWEATCCALKDNAVRAALLQAGLGEP